MTYLHKGVLVLVQGLHNKADHQDVHHAIARLPVVLADYLIYFCRGLCPDPAAIAM